MVVMNTVLGRYNTYTRYTFALNNSYFRHWERAYHSHGTNRDPFVDKPSNHSHLMDKYNNTERHAIIDNVTP